MRLCKGGLLIGVLAGVLAAPAASAGQLRLEIHAGRVTLVARDVTVGQILDEWARVGQTTVIINGDGLPLSPVTLELTSVPEPLALDVILRFTSGHIAAQRRAENPGLSLYDRIVVLSTTAVAPPPQHLATPLTSGEAQSPAAVPDLAGPAPGEEELEEVQGEEDGAQALPLPFQESGPAQETPQPARGVPPGATNPVGSPAGTSRVPGFVAPAPEPLSELMPDA